MSNATHTPGPWHVRSSEGQQSHVVYAADNYAIANATTYHGQHPLHCAEANARLIAAAPELLAACEAALPELDFVSDGLGEGFHTVVDGLRAAIAKAKGGVT
jgi:hypothetical protein